MKPLSCLLLVPVLRVMTRIVVERWMGRLVTVLIPARSTPHIRNGHRSSGWGPEQVAGSREMRLVYLRQFYVYSSVVGKSLRGASK